ncbi:hypothetical protein B0H14DRAFT_3892206 [Mycena olivaceomarginata]|nr:hypothetical protein B0H14DRAFT_3892206 [Mycena olivaceomarginata]
MDWIWSEYTTSPDPVAGMQSLNQTCSVLTKHVLLPTHIALSCGSFSLRPDLAQVLINVVPQLGHFLNLAQRNAGLSGMHNFCHAELQVLISSTGSDIATQNQVVWNWVHLIDKVYIAMMPWILAALPSALRVKLPSSFLRSHGISEDPPAVVAAVRRNTAAREHVQCRSRTAALASSVAAGGLAKASTIAHASGAAKTVSPVTMDTVMADAPHVPTSCTVGASDALLPQRGQDRARLPPRGESIPSFEVSMANLALEYTAGPDSVSQRVEFIAGKKILDGVDIVDRSDYSGSPYVGRFGLEGDLLVRTETAIADMESLLTRASSLAGRSSYFIIDPRCKAIQTLRGTADLPLLHVAWDGLVQRICIAHDAFELYRLGSTTTDPVRQACDAVTHQQMQALDKERVRLAAEAQSRRTSLLLPIVRTPFVVEQSLAPFPRIVETRETPTAVKDPPSTTFSTSLPALASEPAFLDAAMTPVAEELGGLGRDLLEQAKSTAHSRDTESLTTPRTIKTAATVALPERSPLPPAACAPITVKLSQASGRTSTPAAPAAVPVTDISGHAITKDSPAPEHAPEPAALAAMKDQGWTKFHWNELTAVALRRDGHVSGLVKRFEASAHSTAADGTNSLASCTVGVGGRSPLVLAIAMRVTSAIPATDALKSQQAVTVLRRAPVAATPAVVKDPHRVWTSPPVSPIRKLAVTMEDESRECGGLDNLQGRADRVHKDLGSMRNDLRASSDGRSGISPQDTRISDPIKCFEVAQSSSTSRHDSATPGQSSTTTSVFLLSSSTANSELQDLVLAPTRNIRTEDKLGGQVGLQSSKKLIGAENYSVLLQSPTPVIAADLACTTPVSVLPRFLGYSPVMANLDYGLTSAIVLAYWILHLVGSLREGVSPCLPWAREGIGTSHLE